MTLTAGRGEAFWYNRAEPGVTPKHISQHFSKNAVFKPGLLDIHGTSDSALNLQRIR